MFVIVISPNITLSQGLVLEVAVILTVRRRVHTNTLTILQPQNSELKIPSFLKKNDYKAIFLA